MFKPAVVRDAERNITKINTLAGALEWFKEDFTKKHKDNPMIREFNVVDQVTGDFIADYSKIGDTKKFAICWVVEVVFISVFGTRDSKFYYLIFKTKWFNRWANTYFERAKKYFGKDGITLKMDILEHSVKNPKHDLKNTVEISTLVLVMENMEVYEIPMSKVFELASKKLGVFTDKYNQLCTAIPKSEFTNQNSITS